MVSHNPNIPLATTLARHKESGPASISMASSDAHAANTTAPSATLPDTVPSIFGPSAVAPPVNPQTDCPIFSFARELRDMIYVYAFTPNLQAPNEGNPPTVELGDLATTVSSSAFLLTCRQVEQEAAAIFRAAQRSFWKDGTVFSLDLSDDWEDKDLRRGRHFEVLDLLDKTFLLPELSDEQVSAMETFVINVRSDIGNCNIHLDSGTSSTGVRSWFLSENASTWSEDPTDAANHGNDLRGTLIEVFNASDFPEQNRISLLSAQNHFGNVRLQAKGASGRRYKSISASKEMLANLTAKRIEVTANPPSVSRIGLKKRQLEALLEHCWIVWRARRAV